MNQQNPESERLRKPHSSPVKYHLSAYQPIIGLSASHWTVGHTQGSAELRWAPLSSAELRTPRACRWSSAQRPGCPGTTSPPPAPWWSWRMVKFGISNGKSRERHRKTMGFYMGNPRTKCWLVVYLPLWKIWVRQLGWWHSQYMKKEMFRTTNQLDFKIAKMILSNRQYGTVHWLSKEKLGNHRYLDRYCDVVSFREGEARYPADPWSTISWCLGICICRNCKDSRNREENLSGYVAMCNNITNIGILSRTFWAWSPPF